MKFGVSTFLPTVVYIISIFVLFGMLFYKREIGLYFVVAILPLQNVTDKLVQFPLGKDIVDIFLAILLLASLSNPEFKNQKDLESLIPTRPIFFYVLLTFFYLWFGSLILGIDLPISPEVTRLQDWKNHMRLPMLFIITLKIIQERRQIILLLSSMLVSIFVVGFHFYRNYQHTGGHFIENRRFAGVFTYLGTNELAAFFAEYSFIILGILLLCKLKFWRWPLFVLLGLNAYGLVYSFSRGAYLAFLTAFLFISLVRKNIGTLILLILFLVFWKNLVPSSVVERVEMTQAEEGALDASSEGRMLKWEHGYNLFLRNPLGYGFDTVSFLGFKNARGQLTQSGDPHNIYVKVLVEMGIPGLILLLYLFYLAYKSGWGLYRDAEDDFLKGLGLGFAATVVACIVANTFGDRWTYEAVSAFYWVFWALVVRGNMIVQTERRKALTELAVVL